MADAYITLIVQARDPIKQAKTRDDRWVQIFNVIRITQNTVLCIRYMGTTVLNLLQYTRGGFKKREETCKYASPVNGANPFPNPVLFPNELFPNGLAV
jgi:hypothetical protein